MVVIFSDVCGKIVKCKLSSLMSRVIVYFGADHARY